jgi:hypothetical protein
VLSAAGEAVVTMKGRHSLRSDSGRHVARRSAARFARALTSPARSKKWSAAGAGGGSSCIRALSARVWIFPVGHHHTELSRRTEWRFRRFAVMLNDGKKPLGFGAARPAAPPGFTLVTPFRDVSTLQSQPTFP